MLKDQIKTSLSLTNCAKTVLYKKFLFYGSTSAALPIAGGNFFSNPKKRNSWLALVLSNYCLYKYKSAHQLIRTRTIFSTPTFLFADVSKKYTLVKPKIQNVMKSETLTWIKELSSSLPTSFFYFLLKNFLSISNRENYSHVSYIPTSQRRFFLKKIVFLNTRLWKYFFFCKLFRPKFSNYQKRINFLKFNIFFKNIHIIIFPKR